MIRSATALSDNEEWAERSAYWETQARATPPKRWNARENRPVLILGGFGVRLHVDNGALIVQNGFTHHPQKREEWRFFSGDWRTPSRIIVLDAKGGLTFSAIQWLAERDIPLLYLDWRGNVVQVVGGNGYAIDRNLAEAQREAARNGVGLKLSRRLISEKINNSIDTLHTAFPTSPAIERALQKLEREADEMRRHPPSSVSALLGMEGRAGLAYFSAWRSFPMRWTGTGRRPIPEDWMRIGQRSSFASGHNRPNRRATHPMNTMLNYAYAVLETQVRSHVIGAGLDPSIGFFHGKYEEHQSGLVYDLMEPLRPLADRKLLEFVQRTTFSPADFLLKASGVCRLNPQLAGNVVRMIEAFSGIEALVSRLLLRCRDGRVIA